MPSLTSGQRAARLCSVCLRLSSDCRKVCDYTVSCRSGNQAFRFYRSNLAREVPVSKVFEGTFKAVTVTSTYLLSTRQGSYSKRGYALGEETQEPSEAWPEIRLLCRCKTAQNGGEWRVRLAVGVVLSKTEDCLQKQLTVKG